MRTLLVQINPGAAALRTVNKLHRRAYKVAGPNSLWHIDGNHKLIRLLQISLEKSNLCDCSITLFAVIVAIALVSHMLIFKML